MSSQLIVGIVILWVALALTFIIVAAYLISRVDDLEELMVIWTEDVMEQVDYAARQIVENQRTVVDGNQRNAKALAEQKKAMKEIQEGILMILPLPDPPEEVKLGAPAGEIILPDPNDMKD